MRLVLTSLQSLYGEISSQARGVAPLHDHTSILSKCTVVPISGELADSSSPKDGRTRIGPPKDVDARRESACSCHALVWLYLQGGL